MSPTLNKKRKILTRSEKKVREVTRSVTCKSHHQPEKCEKLSEMHVGIGADAHRLNFSLRRQIYLMKLCFGDSSRENVFQKYS